MNKIAAKYYAQSQGELHLSWDEVEEDALNIVRAMGKDNFEPDVIVSIARSGLIPAALIAYALKNKQLFVIKVDFSKIQKVGKDQVLCERPTISQELTRDVQGLKVLVVDEMVVSGTTLKLVNSYMEMKNPKEVRYAVLYKQPWSEFKPNYFGRELKEWPIFPWKRLDV